MIIISFILNSLGMKKIQFVGIKLVGYYYYYIEGYIIIRSMDLYASVCFFLIIAFVSSFHI